MKYCSTRDSLKTVSLSQALRIGLASDGGLFVPQQFPQFSWDDFSNLSTIADTAYQLLQPFAKDDVLTDHLKNICQQAFTFSIPTVRITDSLSILEVFHGPTAAFKDVGARFLAGCFSALNTEQEKPLTIMVATSGDTGSAVASAFYQKPNVEVIILYPKNRVSQRQEKQLTCWDENIQSFTVKGTFDECQKMAKAAFSDPWWSKNIRLSSANSINIGRLLPQMVYYVWACIQNWQPGNPYLHFIVPSGNLGNVTACLWAQKCGFPIGQITLATNTNDVVCQFLQTGKVQPQTSVPTLANAMDVGNPSNLERIQHLFHQDVDAIKKVISSHSVDDRSISQTIQTTYNTHGEIICPHTACGVQVWKKTQAEAIVVGTAHPAKFDTVVEPLIKSTVPIPNNLRKLLSLPNKTIEIESKLSSLQKNLKCNR